jgi:hypothetical protein
MPFFPRILEHLIGLGLGTADRTGPRRRDRGQTLELVPQFEQVLAIAPEFTGQSGGWRALPDAPEDEDQLGRRAVRLLERGGGVGVEHGPAVPAPVVEYRRAVAVVDRQCVGSPTARTTQPIGV